MHSFEVHLLWTRSTIIISYNFPSILFSTSATQVEKKPLFRNISMNKSPARIIFWKLFALDITLQDVYSQCSGIKLIFKIREFENTISIKIKRIRV